MSQVLDAYPFVTVDGRPIPLEIIRPKSVTAMTISIGVQNSTNLTITYPTLMIFATIDCIVTFTGLNSIGNVLFVPARTMVCIILDSIEEAMVYAYAVADSSLDINSAYTLYIQEITPWAGMAHPISFNKR